MSTPIPKAAEARMKVSWEGHLSGTKLQKFPSGCNRIENAKTKNTTAIRTAVQRLLVKTPLIKLLWKCLSVLLVSGWVFSRRSFVL
jgi:hypothetical protein